MNSKLQRITVILLALIALTPIGAWAGDDKFDNLSEAFKWENSSSGCIDFTLLVATFVVVITGTIASALRCCTL